MFTLSSSQTAAMSLNSVLAQLSRHPSVDGIVTVGSTDRDSFTAFSDYDVLVVLAEMPLPLQVGITYIDHRLTDLLFTTTVQVEQILMAEEALDGDKWDGRIVRWLTTGQVVFDRRGFLHQVQVKFSGKNCLRSLEEFDAYGAWIGINFDLLHTRRLIQSDDPIYRSAGELRMSLYSGINLLLSYFRVRKMWWEGDKAAVRYLIEHDKPYFELLQLFLREPDPRCKFAAYERIAAATLAPISSLWIGEPTVFWNDLVPNKSWETLDQCLAFWEDLLQGDLN